MVDVAVPLRKGVPDAVDLVDAADLVDDLVSGGGVDASQSSFNQDADFDAFGSARTLEPETVAAAQQAADEALVATRSSISKEQISPTAQTSSKVDTEKVAVKETSAADDQLKNDTTTTDENKDESHVLVDDEGNPIIPDKRDRSRFVTPQDFELLKVIGMGAFGKVLQVRNKQSSQILAMKIISKRLLRRKAGYIENVQAERNILTRVKHPFVVTMHCSFQTREKLFIIMDFLAGGELFLRLGREGIFLESTAAYYLGEIILGVDHLHSKGILHRDLKPENILLCEDGHICLTDFGLAKDFGPDWNADEEDEESGRARTICGTQEYMSPEMIANKGYGRASDYWSLGCIAYEMLNGLPPFSSKQGSKELFRKIMSEKVKMPPGSTAAACKLLKGLLNRNAQARLGAARSTMFEVGGVAGLKSAQFFAKIDWDKLEQKELEPPYKLSVDHEHDLRHFHDEFTNMTLPRSVMDIATSTALPRRVDSSAFRGFSFIQADFTLPDRNEADIEKYWNSEADDDGESVSETASSKFELGNTATDESNAGEQQQQPEKKKRPPRKRKKKKGAAGSTATASVATKSPVPSEQGDKPAAADSTRATKNGTNQSSGESKATDPKQAAPNPPAEQTPTKAAPTLQPLVTKKAPATAPNVTPVKANTRAPAAQPAAKPKPEPESWQSVGSAKKVGRNNQTAPVAAKNARQSASSMQQPMRPQQQTTPLQRTGGWENPAGAVGLSSTPTRQVAPPGSWAARIQKPTPTITTPSPSRSGWGAKTPSSTVVEPPQTPPSDKLLHSGGAGWGPPLQRQTAPPPRPSQGSAARQISTSSIGSNSSGVPPSPSSDWRNHSSPQVRRALHRSSLIDGTNSFDRNKDFLKDAPKWPSLASAPPQKAAAPPSAPQLGKPTNKPTALKGAWASRTKS